METCLSDATNTFSVKDTSRISTDRAQNKDLGVSMPPSCIKSGHPSDNTTCAAIRGTVFSKPAGPPGLPGPDGHSKDIVDLLI